MIKDFSDFESESGKQAWAGYIQFFAHNRKFRFVHRKRYQRQVKCKCCGVKVSKEIPRMRIAGSWYGGGHLCPKCAIQKIAEEIGERRDAIVKLEDNIADLAYLLGLMRKIKTRPVFKNIMAVAYLAQKLEPDRSDYR